MHSIWIRLGGVLARYHRRQSVQIRKAIVRENSCEKRDLKLAYPNSRRTETPLDYFRILREFQILLRLGD